MEVNGYKIKPKAILHGANLCGANLRDADLRDAILREANLCKANLHWANLRGAKMPPLRLPEGSIIGYKKLANGVVCKLRIPEEAKCAASWCGNKLRAEYAVVLEGSGKSFYGLSYVVGETVHPDKYDDDPRLECSHGIHFFLTRQEAEDY